MTSRAISGLIAASLALAAGPAFAQSCRLPGTIQPAPERPPPAGEVSHTKAGHYVLALTWSPEWCRERADRASEQLQCRDNDFGFVLHGLWPSANQGEHPRFCRAAPPLDAATVRRSLCMTPSIELLQHEWAAHGTCAWPTSQAYFTQAAALWNALKTPALDAPVMTGAQLRQAFAAANPGLPRSAINLRVASGNRLLEVGVCYDLKFRPAACPRGTGTPDKVAIRITPRG
jgi:ribonuclease T2